MVVFQSLLKKGRIGHNRISKKALKECVYLSEWVFEGSVFVGDEGADQFFGHSVSQLSVAVVFHRAKRQAFDQVGHRRLVQAY